MHYDLPSQGKTDTPYTRLWLGVLYQAVTDARGEHPGVSPNMRIAAQKNAIAWFHERSAKAGAFMWLCNHVLGRTADAVLEALQLTKEDVFPRIDPTKTEQQIRMPRKLRSQRAHSRSEAAYKK